jgi:hypothetical protein
MATESYDLGGIPPEGSAEIERRMREPGTYVPYKTMKENLGWTAADEDEWAEAKRRIERAQREGGTFYTTQEVLDHLKSLESE